MNETIKDKIRGAFVGAMSGDALGMSVESMTREQILAVTEGKGVRDFMPNLGLTFHSLKNFSAGSYTDDWQRIRALATSLIEAGEYNAELFARKYAAEYESSQAGWGTTGKIAAEEFKSYFLTNGQQGRCPNIPATGFKLGEKKGTGNGVGMGIMPLAVYVYLITKRRSVTPKTFFHDTEMLEKLVMSNGQATHPDLRASHSAYAVARVIYNCLQGQKINSSKQSLLTCLNVIILYVKSLELVSLPKDLKDSVSDRLIKIAEKQLYKKDIAIEDVVKVLGNSCYSLESIPFSIAVFLRHPTDFEIGVLEAVNAGGDTDTNASMVGAMIGANVGLSRIPKKWRSPGCPLPYQEAIDLADEFYDKFK